MLSKLADNSDAVKAIFDHFRNIGIAAVVFGAAFWTYRQPPSTFGWARYLHPLSIVLLVAIGLFLLVLNELHAHSRLKKAGVGGTLEAAIRAAYYLAALQILGALVSGTLPAA